jgi:hypothetical protein
VTDGRPRLPKSDENPRKNLPIFRPASTAKQSVSRESPEVYWKAPVRFSLSLQVVRRFRSSDYESAALTI